MNGVIILFQFPEKTDHNTVNKFMQRFYGHDYTSWKGGYRYHRHGFLEDIPHRKLLCGVIILRIEDKDRVPDFLGKYVCTLHMREIKLAADDEKKLGKYHE